MKNTLAAALGIVLLSAFAFAQNKAVDQNADAKAVVQLCDEWDRAYIKKDPAPIEKMLTANYIGIDNEGAVTSKADEIKLIESGEYVIFSVQHLEPPKVRFYGSTALVTTHAKVKHSVKGKEATIVGRSTTVCVKENDAWKIASWHASRLKE